MERQMKLLLKMLVSVGVVLLFAGCAGNTVKPLHQQQKVVRQDGGKYYYVPANVFGGVVTKPWAYKNKVETSGLLECPVGYGLVISLNEQKKHNELNRKYRSILTASELKTYDTHPTITPKSDSQEYKKMVSEFTAMVRRGSMACIRPMTNKEVQQYKAYIKQQQKINNDPRVIAARANQQAAMMNYQAATATRNVNYNVNHSGFVNYSGSMYHYGY